MPTREELRRMLADEDQAEREARERRLAVLEEGHAEADTAAAAMRARWEREDAERDAARTAELERHEQGARDRDAARVVLGGASKMVAPADVDVAAQEASDALRRHQEAQAAWVAAGSKVVDAPAAAPQTADVSSPVTPAGASEPAPPDVGNGASAEGAAA